MNRRGQLDVESDAGLREVIKQRAGYVEGEHGQLKAKEFSGIASGTATPLMIYFERWLGESGRKERTKGEDRYAMKVLSDWATKGGWPQTIEGLTRKIAADFISEALIVRSVHHKTAKKRLSSLSSYWRWLGLKGLTGTDAGDNPWLHQPVPKPTHRPSKRPFTDVEIKRLLYVGQLDWRLFDFMIIAALSGMREDEIASLTVRHCAAGMFRVRDARTEAGDRTFPIHSKLKPVVARRVKGKGDGDWLFDELADLSPASMRRRCMPLSKQFLRYRRTLGVDEITDDQRQSNIDFHSFRRWVCQKAEHVGIPESTTAAVVGHKRKGMSYGRHSPMPSTDQLRACVE